MSKINIIDQKISYVNKFIQNLINDKTKIEDKIQTDNQEQIDFSEIYRDEISFSNYPSSESKLEKN